MSNASAYGLDSPRSEPIVGMCSSGIDPDVWARETAVGFATHLCLVHCPALVRCRTEAQTIPPDRRESMVIGGIRFNRRGVVSAWQPVDERCGWCDGR